MEHQKMEEIRAYIRSDAVDKKINPEKQNRHIKESTGYIVGRSYLLPDIDAQELVDMHHGTGHIAVSKSIWKNKETVMANFDIGVEIDMNTMEETITNRFTIHYSKTGTHIVPSKRR